MIRILTIYLFLIGFNILQSNSKLFGFSILQHVLIQFVSNRFKFRSRRFSSPPNLLSIFSNRLWRSSKLESIICMASCSILCNAIQVGFTSFNSDSNASILFSIVIIYVKNLPFRLISINKPRDKAIVRIC